MNININKRIHINPQSKGSLGKSFEAEFRTAWLDYHDNRELILLYWDIGRITVEAQTTKGYGTQVVERLAVYLQKEFPGTAGFSPQNVWYMRSFYLAWTNRTVGQLETKLHRLDGPIKLAVKGDDA
jgi:hypothetical protein